MKLYTYYRSQASFRVRIALNLKGIARENSFLHLEKGDQFAAAYRAINPQMVVPTLIDGDIKLFQSLAILEYLDETYPEPPLLPAEPVARAWVRGLALINMGSYDGQTLAGVISTSTHGSGITLGSFPSAVEALIIVKADGQLVYAATDLRVRLFEAGAHSTWIETAAEAIL